MQQTIRIVQRESCRFTHRKKTERYNIVIRGKPVFVLWMAVWVFEPGGWLIASRKFEDSRCHQLQGHESVEGIVSLRLKAVRILETIGTNCPTTRHNPEDLPPRQQWGEYLKSLFSIVTNTFPSDCFVFLIQCFIAALSIS